jgi:hypothetical protein
MDASNLLKPMLARGELSCIGATTLNEYKQFIEKDKALERRFQQVFVKQPTVEDTVSILRGLKERYEVHHKVSRPPLSGFADPTRLRYAACGGLLLERLSLASTDGLHTQSRAFNIRHCLRPTCSCNALLRRRRCASRTALWWRPLS